MLSRRDIERVAGIFLVLMVVAFAIFLGTFVDVDVDREDIRESLEEIVDDEELYATSWGFGLVGALLLVAAASTLYLVLRSYDRPLALFGLIAILAAGGAFAVSAINFFGLSFLADEFVIATGAHADALASTARAVGIIGFSAFTTGLTILGPGVISTGILIVRNGAALSWLGWGAVINGILLLLSWLIVAPSITGLIIAAIGAIGSLMFFLILGGWLLLRGLPEASST